MSEQENSAFKHLLSPFSLNDPCPKTVSVEGVLSSELMFQVIEREKARADRLAHPFSLLIMDVTYPTSEKAEMLQLLQLVQGRLRATDEMGWLDGSHLCILLSGTGIDGVYRVTHDISEIIASNHVKTPYTVITYPDPVMVELDPLMKGDHIYRQEMKLLGYHEWNSPLVPFSYSMSRTFYWPQTASSQLKLALRFDKKSIDELENRLESHRPWWKRAMDVFLALGGLLLFAPALLFLSLLIKIISPGPALISQPRLGLLGRPFRCWKLRTERSTQNAMPPYGNHYPDYAQGLQPMSKRSDQPKHIPFIGRLLESSRFDKIPRLINVLKGEMSVIGPRPCKEREIERYQQWHFERFNALPGLTGLWQINGKSEATINDMVRLDITYLKDLTFSQDLKILIRTIPTLIREVRNELFS